MNKGTVYSTPGFVELQGAMKGISVGIRTASA
jgi:hypothetical protein